MNSNHPMNSGRAVFVGGDVRSPKTAERSGSVASKAEQTVPPIKVKTYSIRVKDGALQIARPPRKTLLKHA